MAELTMDRDKKLEAIKKVQLEIDKKFGQNTTMFGNVRMDVPLICSSGSLNIDIAMGVGGIPRGRIIEIFGPESSGKTTTALSIVAEAQKVGEMCAFIDVEQALDPVWAKNIGVNMDELLLSQPDCGEDALTIVEDLIDSGAFGIIVVDSVAALTPKAEIEGEMGDSHMGLQARLMSQACRKLIGKIGKSNCSVIFINQIRKVIGGYTNETTTSGGGALKFYSSIRLETTRLKADSTFDEDAGMSVAGVRVKVAKNKVAPPFKVTHVEINTGVNGYYGYNSFGEVLDLGVKHNLIKKAGTWYSLVSNEERMGQGRENAVSWLREHIDIYYQLRDKIFEVEFKENNAEIGSFDSEVKEPKESKKRRNQKEEEVSETTGEVEAK